LWLLHTEKRRNWKNDRQRNKENINIWAFRERKKETEQQKVKNKLKVLEESNNQRDSDRQ
jgi:hypothetical protein